MGKLFIKSFKQRKTNFMGLLRKRISPEQIIQRNWSYKIQVYNTIQYNKNLFKHGKIVQYKRKQLKLIYKIAVWESLSI